MDRLIKLDELMKYPIRLDHYDKEHGNKHFVFGVESVLEYAEYLPTVDAVEVVRCKDCKKFAKHEDRNIYYCRKFLSSVSANDFCSFGTKMDGGRKDEM